MSDVDDGAGRNAHQEQITNERRTEADFEYIDTFNDPNLLKKSV